MENARELLKGVESRNSEMLTIMHQYTNYVILVLAGFWAFFVNSFQYSKTIISANNSSFSTGQTNLSNFVLNITLADPSNVLIITIAITIVVLISWRLYILYLDNGIVQNYKKIILFEKRLYGNTNEIPESSTLFSLVESVPNLKTILIENNKNCYDQQSEVIFKLIENGLIGFRGQTIFNLLSSAAVIILMLIIDIIFCLNIHFISQFLNIIGTIIINLIIIGISLLILFNPKNLIPFIQKDPKPNQILQILKPEKISLPSLADTIIKIGLIIGLLISVILVLYAVYFVGYNAGISEAQKEDGQNLDEFFHNQYYSKYNNQGSEFINNIVAKTETDKNSLEKLNKIAYFVTQNFSDPFWGNNLESNGEFHRTKYFYGAVSGNDYRQFINKSSVMPQYWFEKRGNVRVNYITDDSIFWQPEWIASQNTGGCQELSILFNATANKAGIESRIVRSDGAYFPGGHVWNEVKISGEWKFFDLQQYGMKKNTNNSAYWFGNTSDYAKIILPESPCDVTKYGVYILDNSQNGYAEPPITVSYDPDNQCPHGTLKK